MGERPLPEHDRPETYSAYGTVAIVPMGHEQIVVALKDTGLVVHFPDGENLHYDLEGRLTRIARPNVQWRRGLSGRTLQLQRPSRAEGGSLRRRRVDQPAADQLVAAAHQRLQPVARRCRTEPVTVKHRSGDGASPQLWRRVLQKAAAFDLQAAAADLLAFQNLYHDIPILPPDQYNSLVLLASDGCRYNKCTFCNFYRDVTFRAPPLQEFQRHVDRAVAFHGRALASRRHVFLGQANALLGPRAWRENIFRFLNDRFLLPAPEMPHHDPAWWRGDPHRFTGITSFLDAFVGARITTNEFALMRQLNLRQVFMGVETGCEALLKWLRKPAEPNEMLETVRAAKRGGVAVGVILLVGAGGQHFYDAHVRDTIELVQRMDLTAGDFVYLSPLVPAHGAEYSTLAAQDGIEPLSGEQMVEQEKQLRAGIRSACNSQPGPYIAHYEVENFIY